MNPFQEQILDHYKNPRNFGKAEWEPTSTIKVQNISCGDSVEIYVLVEDGIMKDIRFWGEGCSIAIAAASLMTEELKGKKFSEIKQFKFENLLELIGIPLTTSRQKCAYLSYDALEKILAKELQNTSKNLSS